MIDLKKVPRLGCWGPCCMHQTPPYGLFKPRVLAPDEPVWIIGDKYLCRDCVQPKLKEFARWIQSGPCEWCGRELHISGSRLHFCTRYCHNARYVATRKAKRAEEHPNRRACAVCGETFEPRQSNALTCSSACRQKAYRMRRSTRAMRPSDQHA